MTVSIVACGDSAKEWFKTPCDLSIGVNDCVKFGYEVDYLVVVNSPIKFHPGSKNGDVNRFKTIVGSKPKKFFCHNSNWRKYFKDAENLAMKKFNTVYKPGRIYHSMTSPFVAITLAAKLGATEIIIWGVDMINHHKFAPGKHKDFEEELGYYSILFEELEKNGIKCWLGDGNSSLNRHLKVYGLCNKETENTAY
jgi:hypothetical protein